MATFVLSNGPQRLEVSTDENDNCETLDQILDFYRENLNIPADANISLNGETVDPTDVSLDDIEDDDIVSATKTAGSKG